MSAHVVTGNLGAGKTLVCVGKIEEYLKQGRVVATNLNLVMSQLVPWNNKSARVIRIPDKPTLSDLLSIGRGNCTKDESKNGLLVLDECGTWFNSRTWGDKERGPLIDWLLHSRKKGWDILFIIQDVAIIDKQVRLAMAEHTVFCKRLDRMNVPFIGGLLSLVGIKVPLPRVHIGVVRYGTNDRALLVDRWIYKGNSLLSAYDTFQEFSDNYKHGSFSYLPPWYVTGWRRGLYSVREYMRMTKIYWRRFKSPFAFMAGAALFSLYFLFSSPAVVSSSAAAPSALLDRLEKAKVVSYALFPDSPPSYVFQVENDLLTSSALQAQGVEISGTPTNIKFTSGGRHVSIYR